MRLHFDLRLSLVALCLLAPACAPEEPREEIASIAQPLTGNLSVTSGVNGTVTTLASYGGGAAHPGVNAVDIGAAGGTAVWHQLDYLPADIAGGWVRTYVTKDAGYCSQWSPGSPYYNGAKMIVVTYFWGTDGSYRGWHRSAYQHVAPDGTAADYWWKWNNPNATKKAWGTPNVDLGNGTASGIYLGTVFGVWGNIYNGPGGGLCTTGSHLHQEGDGARAGTLWVGKAMTARYNDVHRFGIAGGLPATGYAPSVPTFDVPQPQPEPQPDPQPEQPQPEQPQPEQPMPEEPAKPDEGAANGGAADVARRERAKIDHDGTPPETPQEPYNAPLGEGALEDAPAEAQADGCNMHSSRANGGASIALVAVAALVMARARRRAAS